MRHQIRIYNLLQFDSFEAATVPFPTNKNVLDICENRHGRYYSMTFRVLSNDNQDIATRNAIRSAIFGVAENKRLPTQESEEGGDLD